MKQEIRWLIDDFVRADAKWGGDVQGNDRASLMLKDAIYLSLETTIRDRVEEYYLAEHAEAEPFAGYEAGQ